MQSPVHITTPRPSLESLVKRFGISKSRRRRLDALAAESLPESAFQQPLTPEFEGVPCSPELGRILIVTNRGKTARKATIASERAKSASIAR